MPWKENTRMSGRSEFIAFARAAGANVSELCRRFGISRKTGYKWLGRAGSGDLDTRDHSRRPHASPRRTPPGLEAHVLAVRKRYPFYGGRKIRRVLLREGLEQPPAASTITRILDRYDLLPQGRRRSRSWQSFEHDTPNALWQMDFKGHFPLSRGRCHPLTVLDDHSRFSICLAACADEQAASVRAELTKAFERYGLPERMLMDNGSPWGAGGEEAFTRLSAWLIRFGISVSHGRPHHPQTQGKDERFHRTLKLEVISQRPVWHGLAEVQQAFDSWRYEYNFERPHEALGYKPPAARYVPSLRAFPGTLPAIAYDSDFEVRKVKSNGRIKFRSEYFYVGKAFSGDPVGLRQVGEATWDVYYCHQRIARIGMLPEEDVGPDCAVNEAATYGSLRAQDGDPRGWARNAAGRRPVDALTAADDV
jgi:transposase InsO family protein